jgi:hypothetical protein
VSRQQIGMKQLAYAGFVLAFVYAFPFFGAMHSANEMPRIYLTEEIVDHGTFRLDARWGEMAQGSTFDVATTPDGHRYSNKAPGASFVAVPAYLGVQAWHRLFGGAPSLAEVTWACRFVAATLPTLLFLLAFRGLARRFAPAPSADGALVALAFGSMVYPYALLFFSHALAMASAGGAFAIAVPLARATVRQPRAAALSVGFLSGFAVLADYQAAIALAGVGVYLACQSRHRARDLSLAALGGLPPAVALGIYHTACFGAPWRTGYAFAVDPAHRHGALGIVGPNAAALAQALVAPDNGLLVLMPWVVLAVVGAVPLLRDRATRAEAAVAAGVGLAYVLFVGSLVPEFGRAGWSVGPRYMACALPFLGWLAARGLDVVDARPAARTAAHALVLVGVIVMVVAGTTFPHWPTTFANPLYEVSFWLLRHGYAPHSLGTWIGLRGLPSLLPLYGVIALLFVALLGRGERGRLATLAIAAVAAVLLVGAIGLVPHPAPKDKTSYLERVWEPR